MSVFCAGLIVILPLWMIWFWFNFSTYAPSLAKPNVLIDMQYIQPSQIILAGGVHLMALSVLLYGIWHLRALFRLFRTGVYFTVNATSHLYSFTLALFVSVLLKPITTAVLSVVLTWGNPPGKKSLVLELGSSEISTILIASVLLTVTWIMREGQQLADENASFV